MLLPKDYLIKQAADSRVTLHVPHYFYDIDTSTETITYHRDGFVEYPDEWFMWVYWKGTKVVPSPGPKVRNKYVYLSEIGWKNMKEQILNAFEKRTIFRDNGVTGHVKGFDHHLNRDDVETIIERFYHDLKIDGRSHYIPGRIRQYAREIVKLSKTK